MSKSAANRILRVGVVMLGIATAFTAQADSTDKKLAFDWYSNAAPRVPGTQARALRQVIPGSGGWICSPAGFGQHSTCYQG